MSLQTEQNKAIIEKINEDYKSLSLEERQQLYTYFFDKNTRKDFKEKLENLIFYKKPPTPEEFLDPANGWLPENIISSIYPYIKEQFIDVLSQEKVYNKVCQYGATRLGKCEGKDTPILMYDLSVKKIQDIKVGDLLMGDDSTPRRVLHLHRGYGKLYKVKQNKADDYIVNENHILTLQYTNKGLRKNRNNSPDKHNGKTIDIAIKDYLALSKDHKHRLKGIKAPLHFEENPVEIEPYWLGLYLGDGSQHCTEITNIDKEVIDYVYDYAERLNLKVSKHFQNNNAHGYRIIAKERSDSKNKEVNTLYFHLKDTYNILYNKHIPIEYLRNSEEVRLQLLAGLLDSNGHLNKSGDVFEIAQKRKDLAEQICFLCRSLGFRANIKEKNTNFNTLVYRITIFGDLYKIPTRIPRKQSKQKAKVNPLRTGIEVVEHGEGEFFGFELDGNRRYLHSDLTITHNTFCARLLILYTFVFIHHLREPALYYNLSPLTDLCIYIISFKLDKTRQLYLEPIYKIMRKSKRFKQVKFVDKVKEEQEQVGIDTVVWSKASESGEITLASGLQLHMGNDDALGIIGGDILQCYLGEINWFIEYAGASEESIFRLYTDIGDRIEGTVGKSYLAFTYLDSSANDADSLIEKHIINELQYRDDVYFKWQSRWEARPYLFPKWQQTGETFKVVCGVGNIPSQIIEADTDIKDIPTDLIVDVPIDAQQRFKDNLIKSIKDIIGKPTSSENKFIQNTDYVNNIFNNDTLTNVDGMLIADASDMPENLLWNQIKHKFFNKDTTTEQDKWFIKRAVSERRYLGIDNAFSSRGDIMGLCVLHKEWSIKKNGIVYVIDFCFGVGGFDSGINLEAPTYLVLDLINNGGVYIKDVASDTFHSEAQKQMLGRHNIELIKQSVDTDVNPYQYMLTCLVNENLKAGRNIFLKNNLFSLMRTKGKNGKEKIDHNQGETEKVYNGDWEKSKCGVFAKDVSDSVCQALWLAFQNEERPVTIYEEENKKFSTDETDVKYFKDKAIQSVMLAQNAMIDIDKVKSSLT